jgi:hypothetical protein
MRINKRNVPRGNALRGRKNTAIAHIQQALADNYSG